MSDKTCTTCRWFKPEMRDPNAGHCFRYPNAVHQFNGDEYWCGEWSESEVTDEHTFLAGGVPAYKVTERENGTSVTEPIPKENRDELARLRVENDKLRELVRRLYEFAMSEYPDGTELNFADSLRELGIEVDE